MRWAWFFHILDKPSESVVCDSDVHDYPIGTFRIVPYEDKWRVEELISDVGDLRRSWYNHQRRYVRIPTGFDFFHNLYGYGSEQECEQYIQKKIADEKYWRERQELIREHAKSPPRVIPPFKYIDVKAPSRLMEDDGGI